MSPIPITVITGFLGSGKTTLLINLLPQLPPTYRVALLKNEFGDLAIDSQLASASAISGVTELLNGCICCNLVGQLGDALDELEKNVHPDRIVIETSGSAFPATLALEINRITRETGKYTLDGVLSVIDVENWEGYEDTSYTAKMQAKYTDLIVLNKWEHVSERRLDDVLDRIGDLEVETPREKTDKGWISKDVVFGLDAKLAKSTFSTQSHDHDHSSEVEVLSVTLNAPEGSFSVDLPKLGRLLEEAPKDEVYRMKAVLYSKTDPTTASSVTSGTSSPQRYILNWAFGRWSFTAAPLQFEGANSSSSSNADTPTGSGTTTPVTAEKEPSLRMTIVTARSESTKWKKHIEAEGVLKLDNDPAATFLSIERVS